MVYRKVAADHMLVRKNEPATSFYIVMSGSANAYTQEPRMRSNDRRMMRRTSVAQQGPTSATVSARAKPSGSSLGPVPEERRKSSHAEFSILSLFNGIQPVQTIREGDVVGEAELLQRAAPVRYRRTHVASRQCRREKRQHLT